MATASEEVAMDIVEVEKNAVLDALIGLQKQVKSYQDWRQLEAIWLREKLAMSGRETAAALNYELQTVHLLWHRWRKQGLAMFENRRSPGGRRHAYLSPDEEREFLETMAVGSESGSLVTAEQIRQRLESCIGKRIALTTVYRMLYRHGWRKVSPRKRHPKTKPKLQEGVKKTDPGGTSMRSSGRGGRR
jgi:transposase